MSLNANQTMVAEDFRIPWHSWLLNLARHSVAKLQARLTLERTRKVVRTLGGRQLADAGIDASAVLPPRPTFMVDPRLMARLMSMR